MTLIELHNDNVGMLRFLREQITQTRSELGMAVEQAGANSGEILAVQNTIDQVLDLVEARITKAAPRKSPWVVGSVVVIILAVTGLLVWMKASGAM
jgi:hypothetical protein